jgi:hypothetical protein
VRLEIGIALKRGIRVIPVLVEGALMPQSGQLPENLKPLARRNALNVSHDRFRADTERLIGAVERALEGARVEQQRKREEQERVEAEQRERQEKERLEAEQRTQAQRLELERQQEEGARLRAEQQLRAEQERLEAERRQREEQERLEAERKEKERLETQRREREEQERLQVEPRESEVRERLEAEWREPRQDKTEPLQDIKVDSRVPPPDRTHPEGTANPKKPWQLLVVVGSGVAVVLLSFSLYNGYRQAQNPSPTPSSAELLTDPHAMISLGM